MRRLLAAAAAGKRWLAGGAVATGAAALLLGGGTTDAAGDEDTLIVEVTAHEGWWEVRYQAESPHLMVFTANEVHLPARHRVRFNMESREPIRNFRVRSLSRSVGIPRGGERDLRFTTGEPGVYRGGCTRFCGPRRARMQLLVVVREPAEFAEWLEGQRRPGTAPQDAMARLGHDAFMRSTCATCHRIRGTDAFGTFGPDLTHLATRRTLGAGAIPNDRAHLAAWLVDPHTFKPGSLMPPTHLPPEALHAMLYYLESLR
jgi:cytochrome c oxidase subunit II